MTANPATASRCRLQSLLIAWSVCLPALPSASSEQHLRALCLTRVALCGPAAAGPPQGCGPSALTALVLEAGRVRRRWRQRREIAQHQHQQAHTQERDDALDAADV